MSIRPSSTNHERYAWVDFAKGFCIVAVVALWVSHEFEARGLTSQITWLNRFVWFAGPFRMPDFFLISGLFLSRVIDRPWKSYLDTKVVHYLYFFLLWTLIIVPTMWLIGRDTPDTVAQAAGQIGDKLIGTPFAMLWFIMFLSIYFVFIRLTRWVPTWLMFPAAVAMMLFPLTTGQYHLDRFGVYFVYAYAGHVFANRFFALAEWTRSHKRLAIALLLVWVVVNKFAVQAGWAEVRPPLLVLAFVGISAVVMASSLVCDFRQATWITYLGKNSIAVYLGFYIPMVLIVEAMRRSPLAEQLGLIGAAAVVGSVAISVGAFVLAKRFGLGFLYVRPAWARLVPSKKARHASDPEARERAKPGAASAAIRS